MRVNHNISALRANTSLRKTESLLAKSSERLSSGYKINHAYDDSAGFSIAKKMNTQIQGVKRASQNAADGISVLQTAEGALNEVSAILVRMKELTVQAANDTYSSDDRRAIQVEIDQLKDEINRISHSTNFNTKDLLNGKVGRKGISDNKNVTIIKNSEEVLAGNYSITVGKDPKKATYQNGSIEDLGEEGLEKGGVVTINGTAIYLNKGDSSLAVYNKLVEGAAIAGVHLFCAEGDPDENGKEEFAGYTPAAFTPGSGLTFVTKEYGSHAKIHIECDEEMAALLGLPGKDEMEPIYGEDAEVSLKYENDTDRNTKKFEDTATVSVRGDKAIIRDINGFEMEVNIMAGAAKDGEAEIKLSILDAGYMTFHLGANTGDGVDISIGRVDTETLGLRHLYVGSGELAREGMTLVDIAIQKVSEERAKLGAFQTRLEHTVTSLDESAENLTSAFVRIMDTDLAEEMTEYTSRQVLQQAGTSVLAQANERPQTILSLLQG